MNFFEQQDRARKRTRRLVVLFFLAVLGILAAVNLAIYWVMSANPGAIRTDPLQVHLVVTGVTMMIIVAGAAYKSAALSGGGQSVARMLGGRPINLSDPREKMLQNVVEEMSIASGVPVPAIFIMDQEEGINAFAAGVSAEDMAIGVTRGTLQTLSRDELQGVIGHEFSHILNGDSRLNLRLIAVLNGIMVISLIGMILLRSMQFARFSSRRNDRDNGGAVLAVFAAGVFMYLLGSIGALFGRLIQSAVSRQREFLADASAVQFTRNPAGLAGALKKIGSQGSLVHSPHSLEAAHLFFGSATRFSFGALLATHPPLEDRIKAIDPTWDGRFDIGPGATQVLDQYTPGPRQGEVLAGMLAGAAVRRPLSPARVTEQVGTVTPQHLEFASDLIHTLPQELVVAAHDPFSARAVIFALLLQAEPGIRQKQFVAIEKNAELSCFRYAAKIAPQVEQLSAGARLPLLEMTLPALGSLSPLQATAVRIVMREMIAADQKVTLFEYTLSRLVEKRLPGMDIASPPIEFYSVSAIHREAAVLLSALAQASTSQTEQAFAIGARTLDPDNPPEMQSVQGLSAIDRSLQQLARSSPAVKMRLIEAAAATVAADGQVNLVEAELLRATAATLDVPLPPMVMPNR